MINNNKGLEEHEMNELLEEAQTRLKRLIRQKRKDFGDKRPKYCMSLPKKYRSYIMSANKRGINFTLTVEQFEAITALNCVYCGTSFRIGVDRISSKDGYNENNTQPCCTTCNLMKHVHEHNDFISHINRIAKHINSDKEQNYY